MTAPRATASHQYQQQGHGQARRARPGAASAPPPASPRSASIHSLLFSPQAFLRAYCALDGRVDALQPVDEARPGPVDQVLVHYVDPPAAATAGATPEAEADTPEGSSNSNAGVWVAVGIVLIGVAAGGYVIRRRT